MIVLLDMSGTTLECRVPETAAEVLDFRVRIRCIDDEFRRMMAGRQWLLARSTNAPELPVWPETEGENLPGSIWLYAACETLIQHASLPDSVVEDVTRLECRKYGIDDKWRPQSRCDCVQCRWDPADGPMPELPPEHECLFGGIDPLAAHVVSELSGARDLSQPYWAVQASTAMQVAQWRKFRHDEEERKRNDAEQGEYHDARAELGRLLKGGRR